MSASGGGKSVSTCRAYMKKVFHQLIPWLLLLSAGVGFVDSSIIHREIASRQISGCFVVQGCTDVLLSSYNTIFGISLAYIGMVFYGGLAVLLVAYLYRRKKIFMWWYGAGVACGIVFSLYLFVVQGFVLKAFCSFCLLSLINVVIAGVLYVSWYSAWRRMII